MALHHTVIGVAALTLFDVAAPAPDPVIAGQPVGPIVETDDGPWGLATASFSEDRLYRYRLSRVWDPTGTRVNFLMLNPSTADAFRVDPTVRRCIGFAQTWGHGAVEITNAYAYRSTNPKGLKTIADPVGPGNDDAIVAAAQAAELVIVAWGTHAVYLGRELQVRNLLAGAGIAPSALKTTKDGHPGHPLYVAAATTPALW